MALTRPTPLIALLLLASAMGCCQTAPNHAAVPAETYEVGPVFSDAAGRYLIRTIKQLVDPPSWDDRGGPGSIRIEHGQLIVMQTPENHDKVLKLLGDFREAMSLTVAAEVRVIVVPPAQAAAFARWAAAKDTAACRDIPARFPGAAVHPLGTRYFSSDQPLLVLALEGAPENPAARSLHLAGIRSVPTADRRYLDLAVGAGPTGADASRPVSVRTVPDGGASLVGLKPMAPCQAVGPNAIYLQIVSKIVIHCECEQIRFPAPDGTISPLPSTPPPPPQLIPCSCRPGCRFATWLRAPQSPPPARRGVTPSP